MSFIVNGFAVVCETIVNSGRIKEKPVGGTTRRGAIGAEDQGAVGAENRGAEGAEEGGEGFFLILDHEIAFLAHSGRYILQFSCLLYAVLR